MLINEIVKSWSCHDGIKATNEIIDIIKKKNELFNVNINMSKLSLLRNWKINKNGVIENSNGSFFKITGIEKIENDKTIASQPIIIQDEIGFLGIICTFINGILHFLMQAKIEPGNINKIQISPTIQATKSNFEQKHGGKKPAYLDYFIHDSKYEIIVDQIQSEQAGRFLKKRNRNIIIFVPYGDIEILPSHIWMTLGQIKQLMRYDNLVNMDTRTVLSCIPFGFYSDSKKCLQKYFSNQFLYNSLFNDDVPDIVKAYKKINDFKMFHHSYSECKSLYDLKNWKLTDKEIICRDKANFKVIFCDIEIEGREVKSWSQPLFEAIGNALFVLFVAKFDNKYKFLVKLSHEIGTFDDVELGPTIQNEFIDNDKMPSNQIEEIYIEHIKNRDRVLYDVFLSEEGGRFYQEQNRNVIIEIDCHELNDLDSNYIWLDFKTLNILEQSNNVLNIQLRNLLSLWEV